MAENIDPDAEMAKIDSQIADIDKVVRVAPETTRAGVKAMGEQNLFMAEIAATIKEDACNRMTPHQWLDENEMEWNHLDSMLRSRPWAKKKNQPFRYPFREVTEEMMEKEGPWVNDENTLAREFTRLECECEVLTHVRATPFYPPGHRVILFTPEFGSDKSYDLSVWGHLKPEEDCDIWVVSWQGYTSLDEMIPQLLRKLLSFADAVSTVWYGHSAGALIAYEMLKRLEPKDTPNKPVALVVSGCPAPSVFSTEYKPASEYPWLDNYKTLTSFDKLKSNEAKILKTEFGMVFNGEKLSVEQRTSFLGDRRIVSKYKCKHKDMTVFVPIKSIWNEGDQLVSEDSMKAWSECSGPGFEFVDLARFNGACFDQGHGYAKQPVGDLIRKINEWTIKYKRTKEIEDLLQLPECDIGPTDGDVPEQVEWCVVGAGTAGVHAMESAVKDGYNSICLERHPTIGGIWDVYANKYSQVNTSEIGYRMVNHKGKGAVPNKDHSPRHDILRDIYIIAARAKGCYRCNKDVTKVDKQADGTWIVTGICRVTQKTFTIKATGVCFAVNRRIGKRRDVTFVNEDSFFGDIRYGYANEVLGLDFWGKRVIVVGAGAFAFENLRTSLEHGAKHVTILGRRSGTTCPKWIDIIAFIRPQDQYFGTSKIGSALAFEVWRKSYESGNLRIPESWDQGLLKPHNHTVSVSDLAFIAGWHDMVDLDVGEIKMFDAGGQHAVYKDGSLKEVDIVIKSTGFFLNEEVEVITGQRAMYPWGNVDFNLFYQAEALLDGAQFGSARGNVAEKTAEQQQEMYQTYIKGVRKFNELGLPDILTPRGNPFGSGYIPYVKMNNSFMMHLFKEQEAQKALLECSGPPVIRVSRLWGSAIAAGQGAVISRMVKNLLEDYP